MTSLRTWQRECIGLVESDFAAGKPHFLAVATPGAGKTTMASALCRHLFVANRIDLVF